MATGLFEVEKYDRAVKNIVIYGPEGLRIAVDFDDVNHLLVETLVAHMVAVLNRHFGSPLK